MIEAGEMMRALRARWQGVTLAAFKEEASKELNGTAFDALRPAGGPRVILVVCATGEHEISLIEKAIKLDDSGEPWDWKSVSLFEMIVKTEEGDGLSYQDLKGRDGKRAAVTLCATRPDKIKILEILFNFPA